MKKKLIIFGNTEFAVRMYYCFRDYYNYDIVGFCVDQEYKKSNELEYLPVYNTDYVIENFKPDEYLMYIAVGYSNLNTIKEVKYNYLKNKGYSFANFIHPTAVIEKNVTLGDNLIIGAFTYINYNAVIHNNVYIGNFSLIGSHCVIENNCYIASSKIGGDTHIKQNCFLGLNSSIRDKVTIGEFSIVGMGCSVNKSITPYTKITIDNNAIKISSSQNYIDKYKI